MDPNSIFEFLRTGGVPAALILFIVALLREWIVLGREYRREKDRADRYERLAWRGTKLAETSVDIAERVGP